MRVSADFVLRDLFLYRLDVLATTGGGMSACVRNTPVLEGDDYERCVVRLEQQELRYSSFLVSELSKIDYSLVDGCFAFPDGGGHVTTRGLDGDVLAEVMTGILKALDPAVTGVEKLGGSDDAYAICLGGRKVLIQDGRPAAPELLSSGTISGIALSAIVTKLVTGYRGIVYLDDQSAFLNSDIGKAVLALMIEKLGDDCRLFVTTRNADALDMSLPRHCFTFLRKDSDGHISAISASERLKDDTHSVRDAFENDVFSTVPDIDRIFALSDLDPAK